MARVFNPSENRPKKGASELKRLSVPGKYLVAFTKFFGRDRTPSGKEFLAMGARVIHGIHSGEVFSERVFISEAAYPRLGAMAAAMNLSDPVDLDDDESVKRAFLDRPFKAVVKVESAHNGESYAGVRFYDANPSDEEIAIMDQWRERQLEYRKQSGEADPYADGGGKSRASDFDDSVAQELGNDEIPF